jgi:LysM repeat protein
MSGSEREMLSLCLAIGFWLGSLPGSLGLSPAGLPAHPVAGPSSPSSAFSSLPAGLSPSELVTLSDEDLARRVEADPGSLGSLSIGSVSGGILVNPVPVPADPGWTLIDPNGAYATSETVAFIRAAVGAVRDLFPGTPAVAIGDISFKAGGRMKRHETHQSGRDVDFGFYYKSGARDALVAGTAANLDLARNWALVRALLCRTDVETILLDLRVQRLLYNYALKIGEDKAWLGGVFQVARGNPKATVVHVVGHRTHYHVRFYNRTAQELGRRVQPLLVKLGKIKPPVYTVAHRIRAGETLGHIARRYGSSIRAIQQYNGLRGTLIRAGRTLRIPLKGASAPLAGPLVVPPRSLPPTTPESLSSVSWTAPSAP